MTDPTLQEIRQAASQEGAEPLYTGAWYKAALRVLLAQLPTPTHCPRGCGRLLADVDECTDETCMLKCDVRQMARGRK